MESFKKTDQNTDQEKEPQTVLTENNLFFLKRMFSDKKTYEEYMETLAVLRTLIYENIEIDTDKGAAPDISHPQWPALKLINNLVGALLNSNDYYFDPRGRLMSKHNHQYVIQKLIEQ